MSWRLFYGCQLCMALLVVVMWRASGVAWVTVAWVPLWMPMRLLLRWATTLSPVANAVVSFCQTVSPRVPSCWSARRARWLRSVDVSVSQCVEGGAFVGVLLAAVGHECDWFGAFGDGGEESSGVDFGELAGVADEYDFGVGFAGGVEDAGELACADHGGFIDHQDAVCVEVGFAVVEVSLRGVQSD